ncbi:MAG: hypothetical protein WCT12_02530 [Verrucomicrobiota bacterium]
MPPEPDAMPRHRRILALAFAALALAIAGVLGFHAWRAKAMVRQEQMAVVQAESMLKEGKPAEALVRAEAFARKQPSQDWDRIELSALTALQDLPRLALIFGRTPTRILEDEQASVLVARAFLHARKPVEFARVRDAWRGHEQRLDSWLALDSDTLVLAGKPREAEQLLRSRPLPATEDATRLLRLALVTAGHDMFGAWNLLCQAAALEPRNPDVRSFRAQILEATGRIELARVEYVAALVSTPQSPRLRDQLADFYLRNHNPDLALNTWTEALGRPATDFIWLKVHFWSRVLRPVNLSTLGQPSAGELEPLVRQVSGLKPGRFFDGVAFDQLSRSRSYAAQRQEVFWLRLLDTLQTHHEKEAFELLKFEPARLRSWEPDLAAGLYRILYYRQKQSLNPPGFVFTSSVPETNRHSLFVLLEEAARQERAAPGHPPPLAPEVATLLRGPNAFSAAVLAAGWREAALQLRPQHQLSSGEPDWLDYGFAQTLRLNRGPRAALAFLGTGELPPAPALLRAELLAEEGQRGQAREHLTPLAKLNSGVGFRAAYLLALDAAESHDAEAARACVARQPLLAQADAGKELLARLALAEGKTNEVERIYRGIMTSSVEAKTWLARQAYAQRQWKQARQITNELLDLIPDSPQLRENLLAIDQAEARQ